MADDINRIFQAQQQNLPLLAATTARQRIEKLRALGNELLKRAPDICAAQHRELHTCDMDVHTQLVMLKTEIDFACKHLGKWTEPRRVKNSMATMGKKCYIHYEPKGSVLNLSTWNAPIAINLMPAIGALIAGNSAVIKPSELAPHTAVVTDEIIRAVYDENQCAVIQGGAETAQALLALPFNHIYYTGGQRVGSLVMKAAADYFAGVTLEMGGKSPAIVDRSADIENTALKLAWGRMANAGQVCIGPDYILVDKRIEQAFVTALQSAITRLYNPDGNGIKNSVEFPRLVSDAHFRRVKSLIEDAIAKGATLVFGNETHAESRYISPTILTGISGDMAIMQEEVFGPVLAIIGHDNRQQALAVIRRQTKPLAFYIFAKNPEAIDFYLHNSSAGSTVINHNLIQSGTNPNLPFGGINHSGIGRIGGHQSFLEFSNPRSVVEQPLGWRDININFPPYSDRYKGMIARMLRPGS